MLNGDHVLPRPAADKDNKPPQPSAIDAKEALDACMRCMGVLYCVQGAADSTDPEDRNGALDLAITHLHKNLQIVQDFFEMDKEKASSC